VSYLRRLVTGFPRRRPEFEHKSGHVGFVMGNVAVGHVYSEYFDFPYQFSSLSTAPHLSSIVRGWYNRPVSGLRNKWTQSHPTPNKLKKIDAVSFQLYHTASDSILYLLTYSRSWALLEKSPIVQPLKNFLAFYGTRRFNTVFTRALHWSLSSAI
jgi:hypothetical protein